MKRRRWFGLRGHHSHLYESPICEPSDDNVRSTTAAASRGIDLSRRCHSADTLLPGVAGAAQSPTSLQRLQLPDAPRQQSNHTAVAHQTPLSPRASSATRLWLLELLASTRTIKRIT
ncbi:hypothetical protein LSAT2_008140 [Lamellibrachia satsuma]|nr:hypothetical protein LSAT2_008140 [Lamellibrachia satsuma]